MAQPDRQLRTPAYELRHEQNQVIRPFQGRCAGYALVLVALVTVTAIYWPGLYGGWLFDDYPNIVDNHGVQPPDASVPSLVRAAL